MTRARIAGLAVVVLVLLAVAGYRIFSQDAQPVAATSPAAVPSMSPAPAETHPAPVAYQGFLFGRITTIDGATFEGRLRWGRAEEAFWSDSFNGAKHENPWLAHMSPERLRQPSRPLKVFGITIMDRETKIDFGRLFMVRFGEISRLEAHGKQVRVTLKSGTVFDLDRFEASDFDDDVRVWRADGRVVDLDTLRIRTIELLPTPALDAVPSRLQGTVRTGQGEFTGFIAWDRDKCVGTDELHGRTAAGELVLRFDTIRSIARRSGDSLVTLLDGREIVLLNEGEVGPDNRGLYVDDRRYGRVLIAGDACERVDFTPGDSGPAYDDFPPGRPLSGTVTTGGGRRLVGRLVYDLDESETTETLDAPSHGVNYIIPFGMIATIVPPGRDGRSRDLGRVTLHDGGPLQLEREGDLGDGNAGVLIFVEGQPRPEYVPWTDVAQVDLDPPGTLKEARP